MYFKHSCTDEIRIRILYKRIHSLLLYYDINAK